MEDFVQNTASGVRFDGRMVERGEGVSVPRGPFQNPPNLVAPQLVRASAGAPARSAGRRLGDIRARRVAPEIALSFAACGPSMISEFDIEVLIG